LRAKVHLFDPKNIHLRDKDPTKTFCGQAADVRVMRKEIKCEYGISIRDI